MATLMTLCKLPPAGYMGMAERGAQVCQMGALKVFMQSAYAGCYIGFGVQLSMTIVGGIANTTKDNPGIGKFVFAALFPVLLFLILMSGALLYTGVTAIVPMAVIEGKAHWINIPKYFAVSWLGNLVGCLVFVACIQYCDMNLEDSGNGRLAAKIAKAKVKKDFLIVFIKGIGCNWLVCMAIFMFGQAQDTAGKMVAIWFPISCFVAIGFEHVPANMYIITLGMLAEADVTVAEMIWKNFIPATLGNTFSGTIIVACGYSFLYGELGKRFDKMLAPASTEPKV